jgi:hypothetical protein
MCSSESEALISQHDIRFNRIEVRAFKFQTRASFNGVDSNLNRVNYCALTLYSMDKTMKWERSNV